MHLEMVIYAPFGNYFGEIPKFISISYDNNTNVKKKKLINMHSKTYAGETHTLWNLKRNTKLQSAWH